MIKFCAKLLIFYLGVNSWCPKKFKIGYLVFVNYLVTFYFSSNSPFNPGNFNYYNAIISKGYMKTSTNCLESLNRRLKERTGQGFLSFNKVCSVIKDFKVHYIQLHEEQIVNDRMNKRKKTTLARENQLSKNLNSFYDLPYDLQQNLTVKPPLKLVIFQLLFAYLIPYSILL